MSAGEAAETARARVCPECGRDEAAARAWVMGREGRGWWGRWFPWIVVGLVIAMQVAWVAVQLATGWGVMTLPGMKTDFAHFVGVEHGWSRVDLQRAAAGEVAGDELARAMVFRRPGMMITPDEDAVEVCWDVPLGRQLRVVTTGWPARWKNVNIERRVADVFADQGTLGAALVDAQEQPAWGGKSWRNSFTRREAGDTGERVLIDRSVIAAGIAGWLATTAVLAWIAARMRRRGVGAWVVCAIVAGAGWGAVAWRASAERDERFYVTPEDAVTRPFVAAGFTVGFVRGLIGEADADRRLAGLLLAKLPPGEDGQVLLMRRIVATPVSMRMVEIGWPERMVTFADCWKVDPVTGELKGFEETPGKWLPQTGEVTWGLPVRAGATRAMSLGFEVGEIGVMVLRLVGVWWVVKGLVWARGWWRVRARERRGWCLGCGYERKGLGTRDLGLGGALGLEEGCTVVAYGKEEHERQESWHRRGVGGDGDGGG